MADIFSGRAAAMTMQMYPPIKFPLPLSAPKLIEIPANFMRCASGYPRNHPPYPNRLANTLHDNGTLSVDTAQIKTSHQ